MSLAQPAVPPARFRRVVLAAGRIGTASQTFQESRSAPRSRCRSRSRQGAHWGTMLWTGGGAVKGRQAPLSARRTVPELNLT